MQSSVLLHTPWGSPSSNNEDTKVLVSHDWIAGWIALKEYSKSKVLNPIIVLGFDVRKGIPSWVSYTIVSKNDSTYQSDASQMTWRFDMRLRPGDYTMCDRLNNVNGPVVLAPLFFPGNK